MKMKQRARLLAIVVIVFSTAALLCTRADTIFVLLPGDGAIEQFQTNGDSSMFTSASLALAQSIAFDAAGNLYVANNAGGGNGNGSIAKITPGGAASIFASDPGDASVLSGPEGIAFDLAGNLYVANDAGWIEEFAPDGMPSVFVSDPGDGSVLNSPYGLAFDKSGNLYVANTSGGTNGFGSIEVFNTNGVPSLFVSDPGDGSLLSAPEGLAFASGNLYAADSSGGANGFGTIVKFGSNGRGAIFASDPGTGAVLNSPFGLAFDKSGNLYAVNSAGGPNGNGSVEKFTPGGSHSLFVSDPGDGSIFNSPLGLAFDGSGNLFVANTEGDDIEKFGGNAVLLATIFDTLGSPQGMALDSTGNLFVANSFSGAVERFDTNALATLFATNDSATGLAFDSAGNLYVGSSLDDAIEEFGTNGVGTLFASTGLATPQGLAFDSGGNLYAVNSDLNTIEKFDTNGNGTVFASNSMAYGPSLAFDSAGNLYAEVANTIEKIAPDGTTIVFAADPGNGSVLDSPQGLDFDSAGNLYVANSGNGTIVKFSPFGNGSVFARGLDAPASLIIQRTVSVATGPFSITNVNVTPRRNSAIITWTTTANATAQVQYGTTPAYGTFSTLDTSLATNHAVLLTGLTTNTVYYFQVVSTSGNNVTNQMGFFSTDVSVVVQALQATYLGVWILDTSSPEKFSNPYKYCATTTGTGSAEAFFRPNIPTTGYYDVYLWYSQGPNRSANVPVLVSGQGGEVLTNIDQTTNGGSWQLVAANQFFAAGPSGFLRLGNGTGETNRVVIADAAQWIYSAGQDSAVGGAIPSWWADYYFGTNSVNGAQFSPNGYTLLSDYVIGLSPIDPSSTLTLAMRRIPSGFEVTFSPWQGGRLYGLQTAAALHNPVWTAVPLVSVSQNTNGFGDITITNSTRSPNYYRLKVQLPP